MKIGKLPIIIVCLIVFVAAVKAFLIELVPPATIGVKQSLWGGSGVVEQDFELGFHLGISGYHKWHFLDKRTHFLTFAEAGTNSNMGQLKPPLVIRTKDNNIANFDLTVTYHITQGKGFELVKQGLKDIYRERVFTTVESVIREELAQLSSEDIYSTDNRLRVAEEMLPKLAQELRAFYVTPDQVLVRAVSFTQAYETKLQEKQLTTQKLLLATAEEKVERQRAITETKEAEISAAEKESRGSWDKQLESLRAKNELEIARILAELEIYSRSTTTSADADYEALAADGNLAVAKAEALRDELRNKALDTAGGHILLARQAAENLRFSSVTLNSNDASVPSILDLDELVKLLVGAKK